MRFRLPERRHIASAMQDQGRAIIDAIVIVVGLLLIFWSIQGLDIHGLFQNVDRFIDVYGESLFDELVLVALFSVVGFMLFGGRRLQDQGVRSRRASAPRIVPSNLRSPMP